MERGHGGALMIYGRTKIIASMVIWGSVGIFARYSNLSGLKLAFYRVLLGSLIFLFFYTLNDSGWVKKAFSEIKPKVHLVFLLGAVLGLNWVFFFSAVLYTDIAKATLIYYLAPIIVVMFSAIFLKEEITTKRIILIFIALLGAFIIGTQGEISLKSKDFLGIIFAFLGALFYASVTILGRYLRDIESSYLTFFQLFFATLILFPLVGAFEGLKISLYSLSVVGIIAIVHTSFALLIYMGGLKEVEANEAALLSYIDPLSAVVYALLIFGEVPTVRTIIGGGLILLASALDLKMR